MPKIKVAEMIVGKIEDQSDRILLFPNDEDRDKYYVIATKKQVKGLKIGDKILYRPDGFNFGWFVEKV